MPAIVALKGFSLESVPGELVSRAIGFAVMIPSSC
jgi:hypothetical protein